MIVVDTNVIGYFFLSSEFSLLSELTFQKDSQWAAPILWRSEFRNVLAFYMRKKYLQVEAAQRIMSNALELLREREYEAPSNQVLRLAWESGCSAYDCEFVVVAKDLNVPLVTVDKQLLKAFPNIAVSLEKFCHHA